MKIRFIILLLLSSNIALASIKVMTFNTTCSLCNKGIYDKYSKRKNWILDTIKRNNPDLISLQEVLLPYQLRWFDSKLPDYRVISYRKYFIFRHADPAILYKKDKFDLEKWGGFWLGKRGGYFSFGWKFGLPRRIQWTKLIEKSSGQDFYFVASHFDNRVVNKENSAKVFLNAFSHIETTPIIFAADTNLRSEMDGYKNISEKYYDSFDIKENFTLIRNTDSNLDDSCNIEKGERFPECRVDHVFLSKTFNWKVLNWSVDQFKYGKNKKFTSDHRAIIVELELD